MTFGWFCELNSSNRTRLAAASSFSLILPGLAAAREMTGSGVLGALTVVGGMALGVLLMPRLGVRGIWWGLTAGLTFVALGLIARFLQISRRPILRA